MNRRAKFLFLPLLLASAVQVLFAQSPMDVIPADTAVRVGKLSNGMTYYIRHNAKPANQAEFYIFHDVGAMQEEDSQVGLAHFLEHMAFNGTKNFPNKGIINYLETIGVKFGANLNAGTGQELTVYNMSNVPVVREGVIDTALLILHDWSYFISLNPDEINKERGVIVEELRTGNNAQFRVREKHAPTLYNGSRYAYRNIIGNETALKSFSHKELVDFYHRWYRTDLQAIIVVGDIDVDKVEAKIKALMSDIPAVEKPESKSVVEVAENDDPLVSVASDPELTRSNATIYVKRNPFGKQINDKMIVAQVDAQLELIAGMANQRLYEITQKPNAPFVSAGIGQGSMTSTMDVVMGQVVARDGELASAFEAMYSELEKIQRYGFTQPELDRAQADLLRAQQQLYDNRNDKRSADFIWDYIGNFRKNSAMPSAETRWVVDSTMIASATLEGINELAKMVITDQNQVVTMSAPIKDGFAVPTEAEIKAIMAKVNAAEVEAYADNTIKEPLVTATLKGSKVKTTSTDQFGATVWTLANGVKVVVKPTNFKADELRMSINAMGGLSNLSDEDYPSGDMLSVFTEMSGVGKFSAVELSKQLSGKAVSLETTIDNYENGFVGTASPKDAETLLQLVYLVFTSPRFDEGDFDVMIDKYRAALANASKNPAFVLQDSLSRTLYANSPRRQTFTLETLDKAKFEKLAQIYAKLYANPKEFTFSFVGNVDLAQLKPLVEKYIGSIPVSKVKLDAVNDKVEIVKGKVENRFEVSMQAPKTTVYYTYSGDMPYSIDNNLAMSALKQILDIRCTESIREEKGGTYGVRIRSSMSDFPKHSYQLSMMFDTDPAMANELMEVMEQEIVKLAENGPKAEDLQKIKEYLIKERPDLLKRNALWLGYIDTYYVKNRDMYSNYDKAMAELSAEKIKAVAAKIVADGNVAKVIMDPKK